LLKTTLTQINKYKALFNNITVSTVSFVTGEDGGMGDGVAGIKMPSGVLSASGNDTEVGQTVGQSVL